MTAAEMLAHRHWELIADIGTWLVIIGVAGEGIEFLAKWIRRKWPTAKHSEWLHKHEPFLDSIGAIFLLMVVAGLAIEARGSHKAKMIEQAENARLIVQTANLESTNAALALKTEQLRKTNLELEEKIQPRRITDKQKAELVQILGTDPKPGIVGVHFLGPDSEAEVFTSQIRDVLITCGFEVDKTWGSGFLRMPGNDSEAIFGLYVEIPADEKEVPIRAQMIFDAFNKAGVVMKEVKDPGLWKNHVQVLVGTKPL